MSFAQVLQEFSKHAAPGTPKHVRLRTAIISAIRKGAFKPGDRFPAELEVARAVGVSLGTVQRALGDLAAEHALTREHGRGTFIARTEVAPDDLWQFRFVERPGASPLPLAIEVVDRRRVAGPGPWADALGHDPQGYCELTRHVVINRRVRCLSRFYLGHTRFSRIMRMSKATICGNLKPVLAEVFDAPTLAVEQFFRACTLDDAMCSLLERPTGTPGMVLETIGRGAAQAALSFQCLWVPACEYTLDMSSTIRPGG